MSAVPNDDHPLAVESSSLRATVARYQHEAYATSLKLQRQSLETSQALDHARALERENTRLKEEVTLLRASPDSTPNQSAFQVPELTLALRRLSDKLTAVEGTLLTRTKEAVDARSELAAANYELDAARALAAEAQAREEEGLGRERELQRKLRAVQEERRLADLVVQEYADLVRKLEGRPKVPSTPSSASSMDLQHPANGSSATLVDGLSEGKLGLQRLLKEFNGRNERLQADIAKLHGDNGLLYKELEVARQGADHDRDELAKALHELDSYRADDNTATKMVSRYMKFSQSSTDTLQKAIDSLKLRHSATLATLNAEIAHLQRALAHEHDESERVRTALDELTEDIARESYGRRREVSLRLAFLGREENLAECLRRWVRKAKESLERSGGSEDGSISLNPMALREAFDRAMADAEGLLETLNGQPVADVEDSTTGSVARLVLAQDTVSSLTHELQEETVRRLQTERKLTRLPVADRGHDPDTLEDSPPVVHPVPHHVDHTDPENQLLDIDSSVEPDASSSTTQSDTSPSTNQPDASSSATLPETPPEPIPSDSVPIVEVVTVPADVDGAHVAHIGPSVLEEPELSEDTQTPSSPSQFKVDVSPESETPGSGTVNPGSSNPPMPDSLLSNGDSIAIPFPSGGEDTETPSPPLPADSIVSFPTADEERSLTPVEFPPVTHTSKSHIPPPLPLETSNGLGLSSFSTSSPTRSTHSSGESRETSLIDGLAKVKRRYDLVQRGFHDCNLALKDLKKALSDLPSSSPADMTSMLGRAVERLVDFNEDARVELEIRIADEERVASGYEALLSIPGAMSQSDEEAKMDEDEMIQEVRAFVDGSDRVVAKATQQFSQKLDDLEHDIASIKRTLHELSAAGDSLSPSASMPSGKTTASPGWSAWTPSFLSPLSPPRSTSPAPPTFGSVMTSPRLRHASSFSHPRERSGDDSPIDPLASLGLRIVVPARSPTIGFGLNGAAGPRGSPRQRTTSGMFALGLGSPGMRTTSFGPSMGRQGLQKMPSRGLLASSSTPRLASTLGPAISSPQKAAPGQQMAGDVDLDVE